MSASASSSVGRPPSGRATAAIGCGGCVPVPGVVSMRVSAAVGRDRAFAEGAVGTWSVGTSRSIETSCARRAAAARKCGGGRAEGVGVGSMRASAAASESIYPRASAAVGGGRVVREGVVSTEEDAARAATGISSRAAAAGEVASRPRGAVAVLDGTSGMESAVGVGSMGAPALSMRVSAANGSSEESTPEGVLVRGSSGTVSRDGRVSAAAASDKWSRGAAVTGMCTVRASPSGGVAGVVGRASAASARAEMSAG